MIDHIVNFVKFNLFNPQMIQRESRTIEYKEVLNDYKSICRAVVAFSNDIGGTITIGIRDKDLSPVGRSFS